MEASLSTLGFLSRARRFLGLGLLAALSLPPVVDLLEATLVLHLLVQIPLLAAAGWMLGAAFVRTAGDHLGGYNAGGIPGLLTAVFAAAFWMVPRSLDAALSDPAMEIAKFVSVPALVGAPLAISWPRLHAIAKGFVWANLVSMLVALGWLYVVAPVRLCNYYLLNQQAVVGWVMMLLAAVVAVYLTLRAFIGTRTTAGTPAVPRNSGTR